MPESPARRRMKVAWHKNKPKPGKKWHWLKGRAMREVLGKAIKDGVRFEVGDFRYFVKDLELSQWAFSYPRWYDAMEEFYCLAIEAKNESACRSLEFWLDRPALYLHSELMYVGRVFNWDFGDGEEPVRCSSFNSNHQFITVCFEQTSVLPKMPANETIRPHRRIRWSELEQDPGSQP
ncbi:MAG: hypothetical protein NT039_00645 [Candidatus Berkelbacteria bacterium]|nr:hypothetical protein [Candidatus Berkelbacteria bacterium]